MPFLSVLLLSLFFISIQPSVAQNVVIQGSERKDYFIDILEHALSYTPEKNYQLTFYAQNLPKVRVFENIATNSGINIIAAGATIDREKILLPIRFPILKGLHGWRIALVKNNNKRLFSTPLSHADFKKLTVGQLHSWSDSKILESNNIKVEKGSHFQGLFHMLVADRFDYFPHSIIEVQQEYENNKEMNIAIDSHALIHYPTAYYFYVNKNNKILAADVNFGLEQALKDGSFEQIFMNYHGDVIKHALNKNRKIYPLDNPFLPEKTPLKRKELWLDLEVI